MPPQILHFKIVLLHLFTPHLLEAPTPLDTVVEIPEAGHIFQVVGPYNSHNKLLCQICGKTGHSALKCFHKFDLSYNTPQLSPASPSPMTTTYQYNQSTTSPVGPAYQQHQSFSDPGQAHIATASTTHDDAWYLDGEASHHSTLDVSAFYTKELYQGASQLTIGNGSSLLITHIGNSCIPAPRLLHLKNILLVASLKNRMNISHFTLHNDVLVEFDASYCYIKDRHKDHSCSGPNL